MQAIITGTIAFASTNIDDLFVLMALFSQVNGHSLRVKHIILGQYIGILSLTLLSIIGALGTLVIPAPWIGFLGLVPLYLGIKGLLSLKSNNAVEVQISINNSRKEEALAADKEQGMKLLVGASTFKVAAITIGNGGDNIAIYIPLFSSGNIMSGILMVVVFLILIAVWCYAGYKLVNQPIIAKGIKKYGSLIIPFVFIGLGVYIMLHSGTFNMLFKS